LQDFSNSAAEQNLDNFSFARIPEIGRGLLARARSEKLRHSFASFNEEIDIVHVANIHDRPIRGLGILFW
jgi:hypothetical protein